MSELDLSDRYGRKPMQWKPLALALLIIGGSWLVWAGVYHSRPDVRSSLISFSIPSDRAVSVRYTIDRRNPQEAALCTLVAHDLDKNVVGEIEDEIPAGAAQVEMSTLIPTRTQAVSAGISRCRTSSK
ncbi:MAG: DUF4307 domain-containing protein [Candidatus Nanopelagicaceae bacterium]|nr:DUF4307 domain-containing protein [Candidatus Nanopelagicaceae bacterium]